LAEEDLVGLASDLREVVVETGGIVMKQGDVIRSMHIVMCGLGTAYKCFGHVPQYLKKTEKLVLGKAWTSHILGEKAILSPRGATYPFTVKADTRMLLLELQLSQVSGR